MTDTSQPRIAPLQPPYEPDVEQALARWMPPGSEVEPLGLFRTLNLHDTLASRMRPLGAGILGTSATVPPPLREIVIHRTCALTGAGYEWGVHAVAFAKPLGFSDAQLYSTVHGAADDDCWDEQQAIVFALADELHHTSTISAPLWGRLEASFDERQLLELIITAGWYHVIAYLCNGVALQPEEWGLPFPPPDAEPREAAAAA